MRTADRFWSKVRGGSVEECWEWAGAQNPKGYGRFRVSGRFVQAHRWTYEALIAPIPDGLQIDHLCRNTSCVNPWHLEPVTLRVNISRASETHCIRGHEFTPANTYLASRRYGVARVCRACRRYRRRTRKAALAAVVAA